MSNASAAGTKRRGHLHPVLIMLWLLLATVLLTHLIPAGKYQRFDGQVVSDSYQELPKVNGLQALLSPSAPAETDQPARAAGFLSLFTTIPAGMVKSARLIVMVLFVGGMFGVLGATGALNAGVDRLLHLASGNVYLLAAGLMFLVACGATFLGFLSEYLAIIPLVLGMAQRLRLPNLFAPAVVVVASMIGWTASVTNPLAVTIAQPLAGVPVLSGLLPRLAIFIVMLVLGLGYVLLYLRRLPKIDHVPEAPRLTSRQIGVFVSLVVGGAILIAGTALRSWGSLEHASVFVAISVALALVGGLRPAVAADAFLEGMKSLLLMSLIFGLSSATEIMLQSSQVIDSIVQGLASLVEGHSRGVVASGLMIAEMLFNLLIHSVAPKAAISLPILTPIAQFSGVSGQVTVTALLLGTGVTNMISPTNSVLLAFLASSQVDYVEWFRFIAPLFALLSVMSFAALYIMTITGC